MQGEVEKPQIDSVAFPIDAFEFNRESGMLYLKDGWDLNIDDSINVGLDVGVSRTFSGGAYRVGSVGIDGENYTISDTNGILAIFVTTGAADRTITLPTVADNTGRVLYVVKVDDGAGNVIVDGEGAETVNGAANVTLVGQYSSVTIISEGTAWYKVAEI